MAKVTSRLEAARQAYREALEAARTRPTPEAWTRLLAAGKELSAAQEPKARGTRGARRSAPPAPTIQDLEPEAAPRAPEAELELLEPIE